MRIDIGGSALGQVRLAISPLWEALGGLSMLIRFPDEAPWPYTTWAQTARRVLRDPAPAAVAALCAEFQEYGQPHFLIPAPTQSSLEIADQLTALCETPHPVLQRELDERFPTDLPPGLRQFAAKPVAALQGYADGLAAFWDAAVSGYWPSIRAALETEILLRGRVLATNGADALLGTLHRRVVWNPPTLTMAGAQEGSHRLADESLILVPILFGRGQPFFSVHPGHATAFSYQAPGAAVLAHRSTLDQATGDSERRDRMAILVGERRAALLRALAVPTTTTMIAKQMGLAPSTVSQHLTALVAAGVAQRRRAGIRVLYGLSRTGVQLISSFDTQLE
jgi:DNA-binding transcriptional ArsR family regulator